MGTLHPLPPPEPTTNDTTSTIHTKPNDSLGQERQAGPTVHQHPSVVKEEWSAKGRGGRRGPEL
jgi:hypothetical protein